jgi:hypothetical protein
MKEKLLSVCVAFSAAAFCSSGAVAAGQCVDYGDEKTEFTWHLCPGGVKYERQYLYFGIWSSFYEVESGEGACSWSPRQSSWLCPERTVRCDAYKCR